MSRSNFIAYSTVLTIVMLYKLL